MDDVALMGKSHRIGNLHQYVQVLIPRTLPNPLRPLHAGDLLHGIEQCTVACSKLVDRNDVGVIKLSSHLCFVEKFTMHVTSMGNRRSIATRRLNHLDCHIATNRKLSSL